MFVRAQLTTRYGAIQMVCLSCLFKAIKRNVSYAIDYCVRLVADYSMAKVLLFFVCLFASGGVLAELPLKISTWCRPPFSNLSQNGSLDLVIKEAFSRIERQAIIVQKPAERSLTDANKGVVDGEFARIDKIGLLYLNLLMVPEPLFDMEFVAFSKMPRLEYASWRSLKPQVVGYVIGWKMVENNLSFDRRIGVSSGQQLFKLLNQGRFDVAIYSRKFGFEEIKQLDLKGIYSTEKPLASKPMYLFMHKRHQGLIAKLALAIKAMKDDGTVRRLIVEFDKSVLTNH